MAIGDRIIKDRYEALKELKKTANDHRNYDWGIHSLPTALLESIDIAIEVMEQTSWISVSDRLPKDRLEVLVTAYWHETYQVMMGSYYGDGLWWCVPFNNCGEHTQILNPKAWMPLPKPYELQERSE